MAMRVTSGGTTTTTDYLGGMEEQTDSTLTKYYAIPGLFRPQERAGPRYGSSPNDSSLDERSYVQMPSNRMTTRRW